MVISSQASWRVIDGELVAFLADSAQTHLLGPAAAWLLRTLQAHAQAQGQDRAMDLATLLAAPALPGDDAELAAPPDLTDPSTASDLAAPLASLVDSLVKIGLLAEVPS